MTEEVYHRLRDILVDGKLPPGRQLQETTLAKDLGVSRTPVREALQLLISDGLVMANAAGVFVPELTVKEVRDLQQTSRALNGFAAGLAATRGTAEQMAQLEAIMGQMESLATAGDLPRWTEADLELHVQISEMADNGPLSRMVQQMESLIGRVRHIALRQPGRLAQSTVEHRRVVQAIKLRDGELAERAMQAHLTTVEELLVGILENFVVPFKGERF